MGEGWLAPVPRTFGPAAGQDARRNIDLVGAGGRRTAMHAETGDELVVRGRHVGDEAREGVIIEIHGPKGTPPYLARWQDGHDSVFVPSSGTLAEHRPALQRRHT
jgi:hypothetical protein